MEYSTSNVSPGRIKLSLKKIVTPFYGMKKELPPQHPVLGSEDLISYYDLSSAFQRFCGPRKPKEDLGSFLSNVAGTSNLRKQQDESCLLKHLVEKPPITGKDIAPLSSSAMAAFKLAPGPIPDHYRFFDPLPSDSSILNGVPNGKETNTGLLATSSEDGDPGKQRKRPKRSLDDYEEPLDKKSKKHRSGEEKERKQKKKKKEKKRKKNDEDGKRVKSQEPQPYY